MAARIPVLLKDTPYEVIVGHDILSGTGEFVRKVSDAPKCALITDANVGPLYAEAVRISLEEAGLKTTVITVPAGETSKSLSEAEKICDTMVEAGMDRGPRHVPRDSPRLRPGRRGREGRCRARARAGAPVLPAAHVRAAQGRQRRPEGWVDPSAV